MTIGANQSYATAYVSVFHDFLLDPSETFAVQITGVTGGVVGNASTTITIGDVPPPTITVADTSGTEAAESTGVKFTASLSQTSTSAVSFKFRTRDWNPYEARENVDYAKLVDTVVTIDAGTLTKDFYVPILFDEIDEHPEHFDVELYDAVFALIGDDKAVGTILDDDAAPTVAVSLAPGSTGLVEGDSGDNQRTAKVTLTGQTEKTVTVDLSIQVLVNPPGAVAAKADEDFRATTVHLTFLPGDQSEDFVITVIGDVIDEEDEVLGVRVTGAAYATYPTQPTSFPILDDDAPPVVSIEAAESWTENDNGITTLTDLAVSISQVSGKEVSVGYYFMDGTATVLDNDYTNTSVLTVTIPAGATSKFIRVPIYGDYRDENDEDFRVILNAPVNATLGTATTAVVTILDDDDSPTLTVPASLASIEGRSPPASGISAAAGSGTPGGVTITATGLPSGVTMSSAGALSGRPHYDTAGTHTITVTAADAHGNQITKSFDWVITDASITRILVSPAAQATNDNQKTAITDHRYRGVNIPPPWRGWMESRSVGEKPIGSDIKYFHYLRPGNGRSTGVPNYALDPPSGDFSSEPVDLVPRFVTDYDYVEVGVDINLDGKLALAEITHSFIFGQFKSLMYGEITSQRMAGVLGVEAKPFLLKPQEHHEVGGKFEFATRNVTASNSDIAFEMYVNDVLLASGSGDTFTHTFTAAQKGTGQVYFFLDADGDGVRDVFEGIDATFDHQTRDLMSQAFIVKDVKDLTATVAYLDTLSGVAAVQTWFTSEAKVVSVKDSDTDYRAVITMTVAGTPQDVSDSATYPGNVLNSAHRDAHGVNYVDYRVHLVEFITGAYGFVRPEPVAASRVATVEWVNYSSRNAFVHEFGHLCGIEHGAADARRLMAEGAPGREVTNEEADEYEGGFDN